jgi:plasmid maintenance system killer protein
MDPAASDNNRKLKTSYEAALTVTLKALHNALSKVSDLETQDSETLEALVRLCAKTWLEFCSQPYRLIISLPQGSGDLLSIPKPDERPLILVASPELKRYGNAQGEDLAKGEVVPRCQSAVQQYPTQPPVS